MAMTDTQNLLTVGEVAERLHVSVRSLWRMAATGQFPPGLKIGRSVRWSNERVLDWIQDRQEQAEKQLAALRKSS